jgi:prevent-host-death family protein
MNVSHKPPVTFSSREFNQDTARAKRAARSGVVFVTDRGKPSHVLMSIEEYERLKQKQPGQKSPQSLTEALADNRPEADFDWEPPKMSGFSLKVPDFE